MKAAERQVQPPGPPDATEPRGKAGMAAPVGCNA
jgi:hypothetical protein